MAIALDNTIMGTVDDGTNSYVDVPYADNYFANHWSASLSSAWSAVSVAAKPLLLISACRTIESARFTTPIIRDASVWKSYYNRQTGLIMNFQLLREPVKFYYYQFLQFPRNLDIDPVTGANFIPEPIMMAQCEQAVYMLTFDQTALANRMQGIVTDSVSIGRGQIHVSQQYGFEGSMFAPVAYEMVKPYLMRGPKLRRG